MISWMDSHAVAVLLAWYVFSAVVSGMPAPTNSSGMGYRWAYRSLHVLAGDLSHYWQDRKTSLGNPGGRSTPTQE